MMCLLKVRQISRSLLLMLVVLWAVHSAEALTYDWKPVKIHGGGFVSGILFHPDEPGLMYCRTDIGGSYRWNPANDTWIPLLDFLGYPNNEWSLMGTESIGLDAQDPNRLYLSCGWLGNPSEIMISTDRGATFTRIASPFVIRANDEGRGAGERFGVDPNLGSTIFYGTRQDGLWKSVNSAANWAKVNSFPVNTTTNGVGISFIEFIRSSGTPGSGTPVIWVGVSQTGTNLFRSTDGGLTWTGIATTGVPANCMPLRAAQDGLGNMYITFCDAAGPGGISTGVVRKFNLTTLASTDVTPPVGQGGYGGVSVDRQNPNRIVVTTANRWSPTSDIYRSTNGGTNWTAVFNGTVDTSSAPWVGAGYTVQGWMFDVKIDPYNSDRVYYVTGGGIFSSYNFTAATPAWQFRSTGLEETAFTSIGVNLASPPSGPLLWSVLGDIGGFSHYNLDASPALADYNNPNGNNNYGIDFAEQSPNVVVRTYKTFSGSRGGYISTDYGRTWTLFPATPPPSQINEPGSVSISADGTRLVWTIPGFTPYYSSDRGATWIPCVGSNLTPTAGIHPFCFSDRVNPDKFYLYYRNTGGVFVSTDGGASFNLASTISALGDSMRPAYGQEGSLWVAVNDGLWRTTNSGASFSKVPGVQAARAVGFGRTATGAGHPVVYMHGKIGGVWGIYRSENQGTNWTRINDDQHQYGNIQQVIGDPKIYGRVYIAAGGRGILYGDIHTDPQVTKMIYQDALADGWQNWSWATVNTASASPVRRGTSAVSVTANGWAALFLHRSEVLSTAGYSAVAFWIHGGQSGGQPLQVCGLRNGNAQVVKPVPPPLAGQWTRVVIPLSDLGLANVWDFDGLLIQNSSGSVISTFHVDDIALIGEADAGTSAPPAPGGLAATVGSAQAALTWNASSGATDYNVKRANVSGGPYSTITTVTGTSFTNTGLTNGTTYYYVVAALNTSGESTNSSQVAATPASLPSAPTALTAVPGNGQVTLTWQAVPGATGYNVLVGLNSGQHPQIVAAAVPGTQYVDASLTNGTKYYYAVTATGPGGTSGESNEASATPQAPAAQLLGAVSRKTHGAAGALDLSLAISGVSGVEPRVAVTSGAHTLVLTFDKNITNGFVAVVSGTAQVGGVQCAGTTATISLLNVADKQKVTLALNNVTGADGSSFSGTFAFRVLAGDASRDGAVNVADTAQAKAASGSLVTAANAAKDVNADGAINVADTAKAKIASGNTVAD